jgi:hypothetical protein
LTLPQPPRLIDGQTYVPLRGVLEKLGARVDWFSTTQQVRIRHQSGTVLLPIGAGQAIIDGSPSDADARALLLGGQVYVPLRFLAEALGVGLAYDAEAKQIRLTTPPGAVPDLTIGDVLKGGPAMAGRAVELTGIYHGWRPPVGRATAVGPPAASTDWGLSDETGAIWVTGSGPNLDPFTDTGKTLTVKAVVRRTKAGEAYLEATMATVVAPDLTVNPGVIRQP